MIGVLLYCLHPEILINYIDSESSQNLIDLKQKKNLLINNLAFI